MGQTDLDIKQLRRALSGRTVGCQILYYDQLDSTMDEARDLAEPGTPEGTVIIAEEQKAGRGRFNRAWISPRGQNLSFSILLRPTTAQLPYMNMAATLAVARSFAELTGKTTAIKWPNDVRINGRKASGILIETAIEAGKVSYSVVGIGANVNFDPSQFPEIASLATSIFRETGRKADRARVLQRILEDFDDLYREVKDGHSLRNVWAAQLETLGRMVRVRWRDQVHEGLAQAVDEEGNLILACQDGTTFTALAGEVTLQV